MNDIFNTTVEDLDLSIRCRKYLLKDDILCVGDILSRTNKELLKIPNFGPRSLKELDETLSFYFNINLYDKRPYKEVKEWLKLKDKKNIPIDFDKIPSKIRSYFYNFCDEQLKNEIIKKNFIIKIQKIYRLHILTDKKLILISLIEHHNEDHVDYGAIFRYREHLITDLKLNFFECKMPSSSENIFTLSLLTKNDDDIMISYTDALFAIDLDTADLMEQIKDFVTDLRGKLNEQQ